MQRINIKIIDKSRLLKTLGMGAKDCNTEIVVRLFRVSTDCRPNIRESIFRRFSMCSFWGIVLIACNMRACRNNAGQYYATHIQSIVLPAFAKLRPNGLL